MTIVPIVIGAFGTVFKGILKGMEDLEIGIYSITEYWEESERLDAIRCHLISSERPSSNADGKNSKGVIII